MSIEVNPLHQFGEYQQQYAVDKRLRLIDVFTPQCASDIAAHIFKDLSYKNAYVDNGQFKQISNEDMQKLSPQQLQAFTQNLYKQAANGVGYFYGKSQIRWEPNSLSWSQKVLAWLNSETTLEGIRKMTGHSDIKGANAQATCYYPGHFLTRHNDVNEKEQRRVAYVLNFTPEWHPDWGGLLNFYHNNGTPKDTWVPTFNSIALFDVTHPHSVSYVAPFARKPRIAITGWFVANY